MGPGIYLDIPFIDYCRIPAVNQSSLGLMMKSPAHYRYAPRSEEAPHLQFGSLVHAGHLEPEMLAERYIVIPEESIAETVQSECRLQGREQFKAPKQSGRYKELVAEYLKSHPGKQQVSLSWFSDLANILKSLEKHERASVLFREGHPEVTMIWTDELTGLLCKARIDWLPKCRTCLVDLKTTIDAMEWTLDKWNYHIQAAFYLDGYKTLRGASTKSTPGKELLGLVRPSFEFVLVEKQAPFITRCAAASPRALMYGRHEYQYLLGMIAKCTNEEHWPGPDDPQFWDMSRWYQPMSFPSAPKLQSPMESEDE